MYLDGAISADGELSFEVSRRQQIAWSCSRWYKMEINDRPGVSLWLKLRILKAETIGTLLWVPTRCVLPKLQSFLTAVQFQVSPQPRGLAAAGHGKSTKSTVFPPAG